MSDAAPADATRRELYVRHARLEGRSVVLFRAVDEGARCVVEADVWSSGVEPHPYNAVKAGPYVFSSPVEATRFVTDAVEAFIALGCDVHAS